METLQDLVTEGAARFDRRPALMIRPFFRPRTWRYRDLGAIVPRAARVLADAGVGPGDRVIVWSVNRPEWGIAFFAIQHLGAVAPTAVLLAMVIILGTLLLARLNRRLAAKSNLLEVTLENMSQGLCMFDARHRIGDCPQGHALGREVAELGQLLRFPGLPMPFEPLRHLNAPPAL